MDDAKQFAMQILTVMGCAVDRIPETDEKRADLQATDAESVYLIEVKHKLDNPELFRDHSERMARGEVVSRAALIAHNNRISAILKRGRDQLDRTPGPPDAFRLIWFHADGIDRVLHWHRAFATFYGRVHLWARYPRGNDVIECYYFDYSAARSLPSVDAMILSDAQQRVLLCLNEFSDHIHRFSETALYQRFATDNAVADPRKLAANGDILVCRSEVPRKDDDDVLNALREETGVLYTVIRFSQHSASVRVDAEGAT
jgi:hypothetical protein